MTAIIGTHMKNCQRFLLERTKYLPEFVVFKVKSQNVLSALHLCLLHACLLQFLSYLLLPTVTVKTVSYADVWPLMYEKYTSYI